MSEATKFDTHRCIKRLTDGGFTKQQAEALADEYRALHNINRGVQGRHPDPAAGNEDRRREPSAADQG
ncbi:MAG: hypothetical protein OXI95_15265 [bacterium]|nr:hypothetical protein [bacterium]